MGGSVDGQRADAQLQERLRSARLRSQAYLSTGDWTSAALELEALRVRLPEDRFVQASLAAAYRQLGRMEEAENLYRRLMARHPEFIEYRTELASLLQDQRRSPEVVALLEHYFEIPEKASSELLQLLVNASDQTGDRARSGRLYEELLQRFPDTVIYRILAAERALATGDRATATELFVSAREQSGDTPRILKGLALAHTEASPRYQEYLLQVLSLDRADVEAPYWIAEQLHGSDPIRAVQYYEETLRRLDDRPAGGAYEIGLRARSLFRLGNTDAGLGLFRELADLRPFDMGLRNDVADLLIAEGLSEVALEWIPAGQGDERSGRLRAQIYLARGDWTRAADELAILAATDSLNLRLQVDLAEILARADRWREARRIQDDLVFSAHVPRPIAERAYELRQAMRRRGSQLDLELHHVGLPGEDQWKARPLLRWQPARRWSADLDWRGGRYRDTATSVEIEEQVQQVSLSVTALPKPGSELTVDGHIHQGVDRTVGGVGLAGRLPVGRDSRLMLDARFNELWEEPVDAVDGAGLFHRLRLGASTSWHGFYLSAGGDRRLLRWRRAEFGSDWRGNIYIGREILRRPYGAGYALRSISLTASHEVSGSDQKVTVPTLQLLDATRVTTLGLYAHSIIQARGHLDVAPFIGRDPERSLGWGSLRGISITAGLALTPAMELRAEGFFANESSVQSAGGSYRNVRIGLSHYL